MLAKIRARPRSMRRYTTRLRAGRVQPAGIMVLRCWQTEAAAYHMPAVTCCWRGICDDAGCDLWTLSFLLLLLGARPLVDPVVDGLVPELGVLRLEHPMAFVGEVEHLGRYLQALQGIK